MIRLMNGMRISLTNDETIAVNAVPMMIPTAMSITFPREMNFLNSSNSEPFFLAM